MMGLVALLFATGAAAQSEMRIQFAEKASIAAAPGHTEFDAYGRRFSLDLESNDRLIAKLSVARKAAVARARFLRGRVTGVAGSWVRLAYYAGKVEGAIWDGRDLYVVSSLSDVADHLTVPLDGAPDDTVVYRLSDTINLLPKRFCGLARAESGAGGVNGLTQFKGLLTDIGAHANAIAVPYSQLDVALIADTSFQTAQPTDLEAALLARLNTADGIFSAQVDLLLNAAEIRVVPQNSDPFTSTSSETLLDQVMEYRSAAPAIPANRLAHLVTAKNLADNVLGIAMLGTICRGREAAGLSIGTLGSFASGLIMAHEIAHNIGAIHDGEGQCAAETPGYLMWPEYTGSFRFSACSINTMRPLLDAAACVDPVSIADVKPTISLPSVVERSEPFQITASLDSLGAIAAQGANLVFTFPSEITIDSIVPSSGTCVVDPQPACTFGNVPSGEQRSVTMIARTTRETTQEILRVRAAASNDRIPENNDSFAVFSVVNNADAEVMVSGMGLTMRKDDPVEFTVGVRALRSRPTRGIGVNIDVRGLRNVTYVPSAGICNGSWQEGNCNVGDLAPGQTAQVLVRGIADAVGQMDQGISISSIDDNNGNNNFATLRLTMLPLVNVGMDLPNPQSLTLGVGETGTVRYTVRNTRGTQAATNVRLFIGHDFWAQIQSVSVPGGSCTRVSEIQLRCDVGTLQAGEARVLTVTVLGANLGQGSLSTRLEADRDDDGADDGGSTFVVSVRHPVDLRLSAPFWVDRIESRNAVETVPLYSNSLSAATDFVLTVELAPDSRLTSLVMADTTCQILDPRHGRCTAASLPHQMNRTISIGAIGDTPGVKPVTVAFTAATEADASDNQVTINMPVRAYVDASVTPYVLPELLYVGQVYEFETRLRTSYRDVADLTFTVSYPADFEVTPPAELTGCALVQVNWDNRQDLNCVMPLVAANSDRPLRFQVRATTLDSWGGRITVAARANADVDSNNNYFEQFARPVEESDLSLELQSTSTSGTVGPTFDMPMITLRSPRRTVNMVLRIPIPSFATVERVSSAGWTCTGTTTLECIVFELPEGEQTTFVVTLRANAPGTFTSQVEVVAGNDTNVTNNKRDVTITVVGSTSGGGSSSSGGNSSSGGGKKGGGSLEWLALAFLGLLALQRARSVRQQVRVAHERHVRSIR